MAITIDASTPALRQGTTGTTQVTNSFSPPANAVLLVFGIYDSNAGTVSSMTDSLGSHLTWTKLVETATTNCTVSIWYAPVGGSAPGSMTATQTWGSSITGTSVATGVLVLNGAAASQTGHTATATGTTGAPGATLTSAAADSWIFGGIGYKVATAPTIPAGQTDVFNSITEAIVNSGVAKTFIIQGNTAPGNSNLTINDTNNPAVAWSAAAVEILAAPSSITFTDAMSGAWIWAGSATEAKSAADSGSGAWIWAGSASESRSAADTGAGAWIWAGSASESRSAADARAGSLIWGGTASEARSAADAAAGVWIWGGAGSASPTIAIVSHIWRSVPNARGRRRRLLR